MDQPTPLQTDSIQDKLKSTSKRSVKSSTPKHSQTKAPQNDPSSINDIKTEIKAADSGAETKAENEVISNTDFELSGAKIVEKLSKGQVLKSKESHKLSQRAKEMEKQEINSAALKAFGASEKQIKVGHNQIDSNVRQYSAQGAKEDLPLTEPKKVTTESKKSKITQSDLKAKTESKEPKEEEKIAIINASKRSTRKNPDQALILENTNEDEKEEAQRNSRKSKSSKQKSEEEKEYPVKSAEKSKKRSGRKSDELEKEVAEEKEEVKRNEVQSNHKTDKSSKKQKESAMKSETKAMAKSSIAKSSMKKVKIDPLVAPELKE